MPNDYINFFWSGGLPPKKNLEKLQQWQQHLKEQNSDFNVRMWVTGDVFETMQKSGYQADQGGLLINDPPHQIRIQNIDPLVDQAAKLEACPLLVNFYRVLLENKLFSFASSFARMLILNAEPGFYADIDINQRNTSFPKSMQDLQALATASIPEEPTPAQVFCYNNGKLKENQVMLTLQAGAFDKLLHDHNEKIAASPATIADPKPLIDAYNDRVKIFKKMLAEDPFLIKLEHHSWLQQFLISAEKKGLYSELVTPFEETSSNQIGQALNLFQTFYRLSIENAVAEGLPAHKSSAITRLIQSCFSNPKQDSREIFTWSHPIHFHMEAIGESVVPLQKLIKKHTQKVITKIDHLIQQINDKNWDYVEKYLLILLKKHPYLPVQQVNNILVAMQNLPAPMHIQKKVIDQLQEKFVFSNAIHSSKHIEQLLASLSLEQRQMVVAHIKEACAPFIQNTMNLDLIAASLSPTEAMKYIMSLPLSFDRKVAKSYIQAIELMQDPQAVIHTMSLDDLCFTALQYKRTDNFKQSSATSEKIQTFNAIISKYFETEIDALNQFYKDEKGTWISPRFLTDINSLRNMNIDDIKPEDRTCFAQLQLAQRVMQAVHDDKDYLTELKTLDDCLNYLSISCEPGKQFDPVLKAHLVSMIKSANELCSCIHFLLNQEKIPQGFTSEDLARKILQEPCWKTEQGIQMILKLKTQLTSQCKALLRPYYLTASELKQYKLSPKILELLEIVNKIPNVTFKEDLAQLKEEKKLTYKQHKSP